MNSWQSKQIQLILREAYEWVGVLELRSTRIRPAIFDYANRNKSCSQLMNAQSKNFAKYSLWGTLVMQKWLNNAARRTKIIQSVFSALTFDKTTRDPRKHGHTCVRMLGFRHYETTVLAKNSLGSSPSTSNRRQRLRLFDIPCKN